MSIKRLAPPLALENPAVGRERQWCVPRKADSWLAILRCCMSFPVFSRRLPKAKGGTDFCPVEEWQLRRPAESTSRSPGNLWNTPIDGRISVQ